MGSFHVWYQQEATSISHTAAIHQRDELNYPSMFSLKEWYYFEAISLQPRERGVFMRPPDQSGGGEGGWGGCEEMTETHWIRNEINLYCIIL